MSASAHKHTAAGVPHIIQMQNWRVILIKGSLFKFLAFEGFSFTKSSQPGSLLVPLCAWVRRPGSHILLPSSASAGVTRSTKSFWKLYDCMAEHGGRLKASFITFTNRQLCTQSGAASRSNRVGRWKQIKKSLVYLAHRSAPNPFLFLDCRRVHWHEDSGSNKKSCAEILFKVRAQEGNW